MIASAYREHRGERWGVKFELWVGDDQLKGMSAEEVRQRMWEMFEPYLRLNGKLDFKRTEFQDGLG